MFADDTLLFNSSSPNDVSTPIQNSLTQMSNWCSKWLLKVNASKCESMRLTRSKDPIKATCSYNIHSTSLNQVKTHKHLGVTLSSDL